MDVLAVDGSEHMRKTISEICDNLGYSSFVTRDLASARRVLKREHVRVILVADRLQGSWGGSLYADLPAGARPFLVGIATHTDHRMWNRWAAAGCNHLLDRQVLQRRELERFLKAILSREGDVQHPPPAL